MSEENSKFDPGSSPGRNSNQPLTGGNEEPLPTSPLVRGGQKDILPYDLPDAELLERVDGVAGRCVVFVPVRTVVVIGKGSNPELELNAGAIAADGVPVLRRGTGGCAVVLTPQMVVISFAVYSQEQHRSSEYFRIFNGLIIRSLQTLRVPGLLHEGTSDIALDGRKIAGTAIYRNREMVFYHAILNLAGTTELMERYLKRPPRMPDYRAGRSHAEFVTSLAAQGYIIDIPTLQRRVEAEFSRFLAEAAA
jgi:lipoate---protein ligase